MDDNHSKRGRRPKAPEDLKKYRNITVDADLLDLLHIERDKLTKVFGFQPTLSQTLRHIITVRTPTTETQS